MRPRRAASRAFRGCSFQPNQPGRGATEFDARPRCDALEHLLLSWPRDLALQQLLNVESERLATLSGAPHQLAVKAIRDVTDLDHLWHAASVAHVEHMCKITRPPAPAGQFGARGRETSSSTRATPDCRLPRVVFALNVRPRAHT